MGRLNRLLNGWANFSGYAAGIESRMTAHSDRVGVASELTRRGASTTDVMLADNWKARLSRATS